LRTRLLAHFVSNHLAAERGRQLAVTISLTDPRNRANLTDTVFFEVPPDFHSHNDSVAAALLTLVGDRPREVTFNFPISTRCAELLRDYYTLDDIGPIDPDLEPRRPGHTLGLSFSGGFDSTALRALLDRLIPGQFTVISSVFEGIWENEVASQASWPPDLSCRTDTRRKGFWRGRFTAAVPLLFADYLNLRALTSAHVFSQDGEGTERNIDGHPPTFRRKEVVYQAGGLEEVHLVRGIDEVGILRILTRLVPERVRYALAGASDQGTTRNLSRGLTLRILHERDGLPVPDYLAEFDLTPHPYLGGQFFLGGSPILFVVKHYGAAGVRALSSLTADLTKIDFSFMDALTMEYLQKFNTNFVDIIPPDLRAPLLNLIASLGVIPFNEHDWDELEATRNGLMPALIAQGAIPGAP